MDRWDGGFINVLMDRWISITIIFSAQMLLDVPEELFLLIGYFFWWFFFFFFQTIPVFRATCLLQCRSWMWTTILQWSTQKTRSSSVKAPGQDRQVPQRSNCFSVSHSLWHLCSLAEKEREAEQNLTVKVQKRTAVFISLLTNELNSYACNA